MGKQQTTIRLTENLIEELDTEADELGLNRSEYIRQIVRERHEADELREEVDSLREQLTSRENRITELEQQLRERREIEEKVDEVALQVKEQKETGNAPFPVRWWKWWKGRGGDNDNEQS
jgi:uncharacterized coiled-coil DUF342 family protein